MWRGLRWLRRNEKGQDLIEFALSALGLMVLLAGIADFGGAFQSYIVLTNAAREGARFASDVPCTTANRSVFAAGVVNTTIAEAALSNVTIVPANVTYTPACPTAGQSVVVNVQRAYPFAFARLLGASSVTLHGRAEMVAFGIDTAN